MEQSEKIDELAASLCGFQAAAVEPQKDGKNPHLRNRYVTLSGAWSTIRPQLEKAGLSVVQMPAGDPGSVGVTTQLCHTSGQWIRSTAYLPLQTAKGLNDAQAMGSAISYLRRYSLLAVLGLSHDDDDAAAAGQRKHQEAVQRGVESIGRVPGEEAPTVATDGAYVIPSGKHKGKCITDPSVPRGYLEWAQNEMKPRTEDGQEFKAAATAENHRRLALKQEAGE